MIHAIANEGWSSRFVERFRFDDFDVSWAGPGRNDQEFCFGSDDGKVGFTPIEGNFIAGFQPSAQSCEAVNGVAFIGDYVAVSTRSEVSFWTWPTPPGQEARRAIFHCGAHGVIATADLHFVAPLGPTGVMKVKPNRGQPQPIMIGRPKGRTLDYYKVIGLYPSRRPGLLVSAVRSNGVAWTELDHLNDASQIQSIESADLDIVDVCSVGTDSIPFAIAALAIDGTLILFRDIRSNEPPLTIRFHQTKGVAYRVFSSRGSVIVLTSAGLYVQRGLASLFLSSDSVKLTSIPVLEIPLEAVDANVCWKRWLLIVNADHILRLDLNFLLGDTVAIDFPGEEISASPTYMSPNWDFHDDPAQLTAVAW